MMLVLEMALFASIVSVFFATLAGREGRRVRFGLTLWAIMMGAGIGLGLVMAPLT